MLSKAIDTFPNEPRLWARRGFLLRSRQRWREAITDFDSALSLKPSAPTALFLRGTSLAMVGEFDRAVTDLEECVRLQPDAADAYWQLGTIHSFRRDLERTIAAYEKAFALDPKEYSGLEEELVKLKRQRTLLSEGSREYCRRDAWRVGSCCRAITLSEK